MAALGTSPEITAPPRPEFLKLGELYAQEIGPWLESQEGRRRKARLLRWLIIGGGFAALALFVYLVATRDWGDGWFVAAFIAALLTIVVGNIPLMKLAADVKQEVMAKLAGHFGFTYNPAPADSDIHLFDELGLLPYHTGTSFEDALSGEIKGVPFQMTEAHLTKKVKSGKNRKTVTLFRGLLLSFPSGRAAAERMALCSRDAEAQLDDEELPAAGARDPAFDAAFETRAADQESARRLFDSPARRAVQKLAARDDVEDLRLGFIDGDLIIAINRKSNSFEVTRLGRRLADPGRVQSMVEQFAILFDVVDEFGLQPPAAPEKPADA
jgi:Protein of unknown function (DUF3137)